LVNKYVPCRGDVIWMDFDPQAGTELQKHRPALVLSPYKYNKLSSLVIVCPITSKKKGRAFEVPVPDSYKLKGVILADQIRSVDWKARNAKFECKLPEDVVSEVVDKIAALLED